MLKLGTKIKFNTSVFTAYTSAYEGIDVKKINETKHKDTLEGLVVGQRTIQEGERSYDGENGYIFEAKKYHKVYIVYYSMNRKSVYVREQDILEEIQYNPVD